MKIFSLIIGFLISIGVLKNDILPIHIVEKSIEASASATITTTVTPKPKATVTITITPTPKPTGVVSSDWQYPGSTKIADKKYQSNDDAKTITDWYQAKIKSYGANVTSFVKTNTNDQILNSLAAAKNDWKIKVTITKDSGNSTVTITVDN